MADTSSKLEGLRIARAGARPAGRRNRLVWAAIATIVLIAIGAGATAFVSGETALPIHVATAQAAADAGPGAGSLLDATGYVVARLQASVSAKAIYRVVTVPIEEGQHVKEGQVLARLDDTNTLAALNQAKAVVKQAEATLASARIAAEDAKPIFDRSDRQVRAGLISTETFETAKASYDSLQAQVTVAQQALTTAQAAVQVAQQYEDDTIVRAPFAGVVTSVAAQPGQLVSTQFASGGGVATVVDMNSLEVQVDVSEAFINRVKAEQAAQITLNAYPDWHIPAKVIAIIPTADQAKATVKVRVAFKQRDDRVLPEMGASVSFLESAQTAGAAPAARPAGVIVPADAVEGTGDSGAVFVVRGETLEKRAVKLGGKTGTSQTVLSGLQPGERVALGDLSKLTDGARIRVQE